MKKLLGAGAAIALAATLTACSTAAPGTTPETGTDVPAAPADGAFPVTIEHALGTTVIESKPERVAAIGWANNEVPLALGIVPVGMAAVAWGDDDGDGVLPWVEDELAELGAETPVLFDEADGIDFEAVAETEPDVILAAYSGLTPEEYATLSEIAPVVAYPEVPWGTTLADIVLLNSKALGLEAEGEALLADLNAEIQAEAAKHPQLAGKKVAFSWFEDTASIGFYTTHDPRANFFPNFGMEIPQLVLDQSAASDSFYGSISAEQVDLASDIDIMVAYGTQEAYEAAKADPLLSRIPAIANDAVVLLSYDGDPFASSTNPSPLSVHWGIADYIAQLAEAADKVQ
ncbi:MAG: iron-siderophore ABC transporter substrate-binding protein [Microbacteriaceae bacterium]|nr:iron-siderophore ABC transporter substrate-binding protein [Microbacteriaceae bacterium]